jgi:hypothetical protein
MPAKLIETLTSKMRDEINAASEKYPTIRSYFGVEATFFLRKATSISATLIWNVR